jgi:tetratricopeptide (TPR) repeat protein
VSSTLLVATRNGPRIFLCFPGSQRIFLHVASCICAALCAVSLMSVRYCAAARAQPPVAGTRGEASVAAAVCDRQANTSSANGSDKVSPEEAYPLDPALTEARSLLAQGKLAEAEAKTRRHLQSHADSAEAHFLLGFILFREIGAKWFEAGKTHGAPSPYNSGDASGSVAQFRDAKAKESLAEFTAGARFHVPSAFDLKIVALDYILLKDNIEADLRLTQSLRRNSRDAQAWYYLGRTKYSESQFPEAIQAFVECLKLAPHDVEAENNVGLSYEALDQRDPARQAFENAIAWEAERAVKDPQPFIELAHLYLQQNQPEKAVPHLLQAISISPGVSKAHEELGRAYTLLHRMPEAQIEMEKAVELEPETASLRCLLGQVYRQEGMLSKATAEFDRCAALQQTQAKPSGTQ